MAKLFFKNKAVLLVKAELTALIDSVPTEANAIIVNNLEVKREVTSVESPKVMATRGGQRKQFAWEKATMTFETDMAHGGTNGTPVAGAIPNNDVALRACAMQRVNSSSAISDVCQQGGLDSIILEAGSSAIDGYWNGHPISVTVNSGVAQAPGTAAKNKIKLAAGLSEHAGAAGAGSTTTVVVLASGASSVDGAYAGQDLVIDGVTRQIISYAGDTQSATVSSAYPAATAGQAYKVLYGDNALNGYQIRLSHYAGTIVDNATFNSTDLTIYLPVSVVGTDTVRGMFMKVTTGSNDPDVALITAYDVATRRCTLKSRLATVPTNTSTFELFETRPVGAYDAATLTVTTLTNLVKASVAGAAYKLLETRNITYYNGTTKLARVSRPFSRSINAGAAYTIQAFVRYTALPSDTGEITMTSYYHEDGELQVFVGGKGTVTFDRNAGEVEKCKFVMTGVVARCEESELPAVSMNNMIQPLIVNKENGGDLLLHGYQDVVISKFSADLGNDVIYRNAPGSELVRIKDRLSKMTCTVDKAALSDFDIYAVIQSDSIMPFMYVNGDIGQQTVLFFDATQINNRTPSDSDGILTHDLDMAILPTGTGGTDFRLIFT